MWQAYEIAESVDEAVDILARHAGRARLIAGGTDLLIDLRDGRRRVECLVDVTRIPGLDGIDCDGEWIAIGANVTFRQLKESPLLHERARVLAEAAASVGALPIQAVATLAGNVANAMPAADGAVALVAFDAEALVVDCAGRTWQPVAGLFCGPGQSAVDPTRQMIAGFRFRVAPRHGSAWERIGRRQALVLPILNCGASVTLDGDGRIATARLALGPVAPIPFRARAAEASLDGQPAGDEAYRRAGEIAASECAPRSNVLRASAAYRTEVLPVLVRRALARAAEQARRA